MPLYEWRCARCDLTFEALVAVGAAKRKRPCPRCRRPAAHVMSAARLNLGRLPPPIDTRPAGAKPDVTQLKVPSAARMCWMDDRSAARLAAYKHGRGAEYDDRIAARDEAKKNYGVAEKPSSHSHGHSPLADRALFARRAAAARKSAGKSEAAR
jgi:putative FmdB family regulatory protein